MFTHILVTMISILFLSLGIEALQCRVILKMNRKRVLARFFAPTCSLVTLRESVLLTILLAVERELAESGDFNWLGVNPPVHQIEMVAGLVHHKATRVCLASVPPAEVVGTMDGIQEPLEVNRED